MQRGDGGMSELFSGAKSITPLSMQFLPLRRCSFSPSLIPAFVGAEKCIRLKSCYPAIRERSFVSEKEAPPRISSHAAAINVRELNRQSRERNVSRRACKVYAREVKKRFLDKRRRSRRLRSR